MKKRKIICAAIGCIVLLLIISGAIVFRSKDGKVARKDVSKTTENRNGRTNERSDNSSGKSDIQTDDSNTKENDKIDEDDIKRNDQTKVDGTERETNEQNVKESTQPEEFNVPEIEVKQSSDGEGDNAPVTVKTDKSVELDKIEGYSSNQEEQATIEDSIRITSIGSYTGNYVEDGSDEPVSEVLSIVVTNVSERFLQYSQITMTNGTDTATFSLSNLPAGASALVLAENRISAEGSWSYQDDTSAFIDEAEMHSDIFLWHGGDHMVALTNQSTATYEKVYVYYKNTQNGMYIGGITYRVAFENLGAGETAKKASIHFDGNNSHVMMIDYINE